MAIEHITRDAIVAYVTAHPRCSVVMVARAFGISTHRANAHLARATESGQLARSGRRSAYRYVVAPRGTDDVLVALHVQRRALLARSERLAGQLDAMFSEIATLDERIAEAERDCAVAS